MSFRSTDSRIGDVVRTEGDESSEKWPPPPPGRFRSRTSNKSSHLGASYRVSILPQGQMRNSSVMRIKTESSMMIDMNVSISPSIIPAEGRFIRREVSKNLPVIPKE